MLKRFSQKKVKNNLAMMKYYYALCLVFLIFSCQDNTKRELAILGEKHFENGDTIYHTVPDFSFIDQDSQVVNNATFAGKAYVVDFFFVSCPTICPKVTAQMKRLYDKFENEPNLMFLAHTIDTRHDTIARLKKYAEKAGVRSDRWKFVTGDEDKIFAIADDYFSIAIKDGSSPGGFDHSGRLILVDKNRHIRSFCDGTDPKSVDQFMTDIELLLKSPD